MAIYHFTASKGKKGAQSAQAKHAYISRSGKYKREDLLMAESGNMPEWAQADPNVYWRAADENERANGRVFRAYEFSLPVELDQEAMKELARSFCQELADAPEGKLPYSFAIHQDAKGENPHCHLIVSERVNDGISRTSEAWFKRANKKALDKGGAVKADSLEKKERLYEIRKLWADRANHALATVGLDVRIDHRSLADQGIDRLPQLHIGPHVLEMEEKGIITEKGTKANERYREIERSKEIARISRADRAISAEYGIIGRRSPKQDEHGTKYNFGNGKDKCESNYGNARNIEASQDIPSEILSDSGIDSFDYFDSSTERIIALAEPLRNRKFEKRNSNAERQDLSSSRAGETGGDVAEHGEELAIYGRTQSENLARNGKKDFERERVQKADRTTEAVKNQIRAMGCSLFEVGVRNEKGMINREFSSEEVIKAIPWLKRMNAQGNDIYIRPAASEQSALILLDDLDPIDVEAMREQGLAPALVVETSHKNCQAWLKLSLKSLSDAIRSDIAKKMAQELGADPVSAEKRHYGRLAGFTNRKEKHLTLRGFPYVLCRSSSGVIAERGKELVDEAIKRQEARRLELEAQEKYRQRIRNIENVKVDHFFKPAPGQAFMEYMREWLAHQQGKPDWSKGDYAVACRMAKERYDQDGIAKAILEHSPSIDTRKAGHGADYAQRTANAACNDKSVLEAIEAMEFERQKQKERERSRSHMGWER